MFILEPVIHETIWGGNKLQRYTEDNTKKTGHLYMVNGHEKLSNPVINGVYAGKTLRDVFAAEKVNWGMACFDEFPLTIALVDASENLSIQVHPDDVTAERLENRKIGKTESWLFLDGPVEGWIYGGCHSTKREQIVEAVQDGKMEEITAHFPVKSGDYVCVKAGTLHAMTAGSLVYEIEYGSDFTYRFYDYNRIDSNGRMRELHISKAIEAIKPEEVLRSLPVTSSQWISEQHYEICWLENVSCYQNKGGQLELLSIIDGEGRYEDTVIKGGMSVILLPGEMLDLSLMTVIAARMKKG